MTESYGGDEHITKEAPEASKYVMFLDQFPLNFWDQEFTSFKFEQNNGSQSRNLRADTDGPIDMDMKSL
jgi:hypothetical protein